ncbi:hypothetical protein E2P81_ATG11148 [Venturia nashicola]|nr:hypothetical protein E2P81_ATG11148 [Venturia nashicola]
MPLPNTSPPDSQGPLKTQTYHIIRAREILLSIALLLIILAAGALICYFCVFRDSAPRIGDTAATDSEGGGQEGYKDDDDEGGESDVVRREAVMKKVAEEEGAERNYAKREAMESDALMEGFDSRSHLG